MKLFDGKILFLDRSDINTDEIIPAKYLTEITKEALKPYLLEDLKLENFDVKNDLKDVKAVITRANFGCGSSREHAPWAFEVNNINIIIAESFARIFRQNMYNCGMMAVELDPKIINELFQEFYRSETYLKTDFDNSKFIFSSGGKTKEVSYSISDFDRDLIVAGGWLDYADGKY